MQKLFAAFPVAVFLLAGCQGDDAKQAPGGNVQTEKSGMKVRNVIKVIVSAGGDITADGEPVTLEQLAAKFADLKRANGTVWYHRANPAGDPHPQAMKVIELVVANKLPVKLSSKPDFSDSVNDKGLSQPDP